jgi:hypothetical protein
MTPATPAGRHDHECQPVEYAPGQPLPLRLVSSGFVQSGIHICDEVRPPSRPQRTGLSVFQSTLVCRDAWLGPSSLESASTILTRSSTSTGVAIVKLTGGQSWGCATIGGSGALHRALYVRDVCGLQIAAAESPPRAHGVHPRVRPRLDRTDQVAAAEQWLAWWHALVNLQARLYDPTAAGMALGARERLERHQAIRRSWDEQGWMTERPALARAAAVASESFAAGRASGVVAHAPYEIMKSVAEEVIAERRVEPSKVRLLLVSLPVPGRWWHLWSPGVALVAEDAVRGESQATEVLRAGYLSAV